MIVSSASVCACAVLAPLSDGRVDVGDRPVGNRPRRPRPIEPIRLMQRQPGPGQVEHHELRGTRDRFDAEPRRVPARRRGEIGDEVEDVPWRAQVCALAICPVHGAKRRTTADDRHTLPAVTGDRPSLTVRLADASGARATRQSTRSDRSVRELSPGNAISTVAGPPHGHRVRLRRGRAGYPPGLDHGAVQARQRPHGEPRTHAGRTSEHPYLQAPTDKRQRATGHAERGFARRTVVRGGHGL